MIDNDEGTTFFSMPTIYNVCSYFATQFVNMDVIIPGYRLVIEKGAISDQSCVVKLGNLKSYTHLFPPCTPAIKRNPAIE